MVTYNHPTKRLNEIITKIRKRPEGETLGQALAQIAGVNSNDEVETLLAYVEFIKLARESRNEVVNTEKAKQDLHIKPIERIEAVITELSSKSNCKQLLTRIEAPDFIHLSHMVDFTERLTSEHLIDKAQLDELLSSVIALKQEVDSADLPTVLKEFLLEQLANIEHSIRFYKINGIKGLKRTLELVIGSYSYTKLRLRNELGEDNIFDREEVWQKFWDILGRLDVVISLGTASIPLLSAAIKGLLGG